VTAPRVPTVAPDLLASIAAKIAARRTASPKPEETASPPRRPYHEAAAVHAYFDPATLEPLGPVPDGIPIAGRFVVAGIPQHETIAPLDALLADSVQTTVAGRRLWSLKSEVRIGVLRQLREENRIADALARNAGVDDPVERVLHAFLQATPLAIHGMTRDELAATREVAGWLRNAGFENLPSREEIVARFEWKALLEPFEHLAGEHFGGRAAELTTLREYADVLPPVTVIGALRAAAARAFNFTQKPPLVIYGPGGVGKSTLVARFILEHARAHETERFPFAYLDFDRSEVEFDQPITLILEAVRQLGVQYVHAREQCESLRREWLTDFGPRQPGKVLGEVQTIAPVNSSALARLLARATRDFVTLLGSLGVTDRPVVFVLDTFEEVQRRSEEYVGTIWRMVDDLRAAIPRLRVVIIGRSDLAGVRTQAMPLKGLDREAAVGYLVARGVRDRSAAARLARQLGGSPLSLKLAIEVLKREGLDGSGQLDIATREYFFLRVDDALIQRQLYARILNYVQDEEVRRLAHPGLVLRQITPDLILQVLREPCGLDAVRTLADAENLFQRIRREVALVSVVDGNTVRHRSDLRLLMVPLVRAAEPGKASQIDAMAARYYAAQTTAAARAEEIYHRLWLNQPLSEISSRWLPGVEPFLASAVDEYSGARKAYLASRLGLEVDETTRTLAELEDWERLTERRATDLLRSNEPERALAALSERAERSPSSPLPALEAQSLVALGRGEEALTVLDRAVASGIEAGDRPRALELAAQAAVVAVRIDHREVAARYRARFAGFRQASATPLERLATAVPALAMGDLELEIPSAVLDGLRSEVDAAFDAVGDDELAHEGARPVTLWAATLMRSPVRLARALRLVSMRPASASAVRQLAGELAQFDSTLSTAAGEKAGVLVRRLHVRERERETLTETWSDFVVKAPLTDVQELVATVLDEYAEAIPGALIDAVRRLPRTALGVERDASPNRTPGGHSSAQRSFSTAQVDGLRDALLAAFPSHEALAELLDVRLDTSIHAIASSDEPLAATARRIIATARDQGRLLSLVASALEARPNSARLRAIAQELGVATLAGDLEAMAPGTAFTTRADWRDQLIRLQGQVGRIEAAGVPVCTGFLVGLDLVLTADIAVANLAAGAVENGVVAVRFDYQSDVSSRTLSEGTLYKVDALVHISPLLDETNGLGYALLKVSGSPGYQPIGAPNLEREAILRRWIELPASPRTPHPGETLLVVHHATEGGLRVDISQAKAVSPRGTRLHHEIATGALSAGSPLFSANFELVAMQLRRPTAGWKSTNGAVPIAAIVRDLGERGYGFTEFV
jgi:hypothetical protein